MKPLWIPIELSTSVPSKSKKIADIDDIDSPHNDEIIRRRFLFEGDDL